MLEVVSEDWIPKEFRVITFWFMMGFAILAIITFNVWILFWRVRLEENTLKAHFGKEWDMYARESKKLIPFLY